jgi:SAM-dependent methyltransferase
MTGLVRTVHPLAESFAGVAEAYERGRPEYPPAVAGAIAAELGFGTGARVLDLGAGTGKLTRVLLGFGLDVVAVEPLAALRSLLAEQIGAERVLEGLAEAIPLEDGAVAAVTVADAFHWFDRPRALSEMRRVVRPGGGLAILDKIPDWGGASWAEELATLIMELRPEHPHFDGRPWQEYVGEAEGWSEPWIVRVTGEIPLEPEQIVDHAASMSWIAAMPEPRRSQTLARIRELVRAGHTPQRMCVHTEIGLARRL